METSGVNFGSFKTFILSARLKNIRIGTSLNILVTHNLKLKHKANLYFRERNMLPRNNANVTYCEKTVFYFQNKLVYRAEDRPKDISLKLTFT